MQPLWQLGAQFGNHMSRNQSTKNQVYVQIVTLPITELINPSKMCLHFIKHDSNHSYFHKKIKDGSNVG
jgi:hypothetical protein